MKKIVISIFTLALISTSAFAVIPKGCQSNLDDVINNQIEFNKKAPELIASGELTNQDIIDLNNGQKNVNEVVALLCSGLRKLELQRSISGRLGFISQEEADREASLSYDQALEYIEENVK